MKTKKKILLSAVPIIAVAAVLLSLMLLRGGRLAVGSEEPAEVRFADSVYTLSCITIIRHAALMKTHRLNSATRKPFALRRIPAR